MRKWNTTKLIAVGSLGVLSIVLQLVGASITAITGIPLASGLINVLVAPIMIIICLLVVDQFGAATIMYIIIGILSLPLPLGGISGFLPKIPIAIIEGFIADILYLFLKQKKKVTPLIIGGLTMLYAGVSTVEIGKLLNVPGIEKTANFFYSPLGIGGALIGGAIGGYLGYTIYKKIENAAVLKRIQCE